MQTIAETGATRLEAPIPTIHAEGLPDSEWLAPAVALNQILYGPPGTGKTYQVIDEALRVLDPAFLEAHPGQAQRSARKARYDALEREGRVTFVTFHQSFGYEDFIEGIKPVMKEGQLHYDLEDGLFLRAVKAAGGELADSGPHNAPRAPLWPQDVDPAGKVWRLYIDGTVLASPVRELSLKRNEIRIGSWGSAPRSLEELEDDDLNAQQLLFKDSIRNGDIVLLATGKDKIGAVGVVTGDYRFGPSETIFAFDYAHSRSVRWLAQDLHLSAHEVTGRGFAPPTLQRVRGVKPADVLQFLPAQEEETPTLSLPPRHVLVIDEINRGNIAKVFGELITLLEHSKRAGASESLSVTLPLSKRILRVPQSLYVIGTMNTADRSLTQLDAALRRRFVFRPVWTEPEVLPVLDVGGVKLDLRKLLHAINDRLEGLLSREQVIGHAYLLGLPATLGGVASALRERILPLLEEYFFEDWSRIREVLDDDHKPEHLQFVRRVNTPQGLRYSLNPAAFNEVEAFTRIYSRLGDDAFPFEL